jgi:hypothetical protein
MTAIQNVVQVTVDRQTNFPTVRDLNTILVLSVHTRFAEEYRIYETASAMLTDGFLTSDFAYKAVSAIFSQNPRPAKVVVGKKLSGDTYTVAVNKAMAAYNQFLFLITDATLDADKLAIAALIETTEKFYVLSSSAAAITSGTAGNLFIQLSTLLYTRTFYMYSLLGAATTVPEAAWCGRFAPVQIGSTTWIYKPLVGMIPDNLSPTQEANLKAVNACWYTTVDGDRQVVFGDNKVASGEYIDVMLGVQWIITRMRERVWGTMLNAAKINFDNAGIGKIQSDAMTVLAEAVGFNILSDSPQPVVTVPNALSLTSAERNTRNLAGVKFKARLAGAIQTALNIEGVVYA